MNILVNFQSEDYGGHVGSPNMLAFELRTFIILFARSPISFKHIYVW